MPIYIMITFLFWQSGPRKCLSLITVMIFSSWTYNRCTGLSWPDVRIKSTTVCIGRSDRATMPGIWHEWHFSRFIAEVMWHVLLNIAYSLMVCCALTKIQFWHTKHHSLYSFMVKPEWYKVVIDRNVRYILCPFPLTIIQRYCWLTTVAILTKKWRKTRFRITTPYYFTS